MRWRRVLSFSQAARRIFGSHLLSTSAPRQLDYCQSGATTIAIRKSRAPTAIRDDVATATTAISEWISGMDHSPGRGTGGPTTLAARTFRNSRPFPRGGGRAVAGPVTP